MGYTIQDARDDLYNSDLLTKSSGSAVFTSGRADVAIRRAFQEFAYKTGVLRTSVDVVATSGVRFVEPVVDAPRFMSGKRYAPPFLGDVSGTANDWKTLKVIEWSSMLNEYDQNPQSGAPDVVSWLGDKAYLNPVPDAAYTITFPYEDTLIDYTPGTKGNYDNSATYDYLDCVTYATDGKDYQYINETAGSGNLPTDTTYWKQRDTLTVVDPYTTELNIPERFCSLVVSTGALYYLVRGVPGHAQWPTAGQHFQELIESVRGGAVETGVYYPDGSEFI